jgi:hypothetical protein
MLLLDICTEQLTAQLYLAALFEWGAIIPVCGSNEQ